MSSTAPIPQYKKDLLAQCLSSNILTFGTYTLKSGRQSPYFFNAGLFSKVRPARAISQAYARTLAAHSASNPSFHFDVLFGPAYKGIPLVATTCCALGDVDATAYEHVGYSFNRKEVKDHGEGGLLVGEALKGKKIVIVDDVMTAGTAIREAVSIIEAQGGELVGIVVALDRQEKTTAASEKEGRGDDGSARPSTVAEVRRETGVPVLAVLTLADLIEGVKGMATKEQVEGMEAYRAKYGASD